MVSLDILEVVIGLAFIYMILSLITTTLTEFVSQIFAMRGSNLYRGIQTLLNDLEGTGLARRVYDHPLVKSLGHQGTILNTLGRPARPSYLNPETFARTLLDLLANNGKLNPSDFKYFEDAEKILEAVRTSSLMDDNPQVQRQLQIVLQGARTLQEAQNAIEAWFNDMMDRVGGWYKRHIQVVTLIVSLLVSVIINGDTLSLFNRLTNDPAVRTAFVGAAEKAIQSDFVSSPAPEATLEPGATPLPVTPDLAGTYAKVNSLQQQINMSFQLVGWVFPPVAPTEAELSGLDDAGKKALQDKYQAEVNAYPTNAQRLPQNTADLVSKIIGLLLTTVAVSLGAPFWFDVLKRITSIRAAGGVSGDTPATMAPTVVPAPPPKPDDQKGVG